MQWVSKVSWLDHSTRLVPRDLAHTASTRTQAVQYYKDINPATLTGAIDVIVVERATEVPGQVELACSPFHVRFGKLSVLRPVDKKVSTTLSLVARDDGGNPTTETFRVSRWGSQQVRISVNDERVPFYMKVGETGEAFFVFETEADVPESLQTSPLSGPVSDDGNGDAGVSNRLLSLR
jgi:phosphatidate phosphatase LPIN